MERYYPFSAEDTAVAVNVYRSAHSVPMHRHMFWELFLAVRGSCRHMSEAGETVLLPGDLCVVPPHTDHCFEMQGEVEIYNCQCWPDKLESGERMMLWDVAEDSRCSGVIRLPAEQADYVRQRLDEILCEQKALQADSEAVRRAALTLVLVTVRRAYRQQEARANRIDGGSRACVQWAVQYIEKHLCEPMDFGALAKEVHLSEKYFRQVFKDVMGLPPVEYRNRRRVVRSLIYLQQGCPVSEAGEQVGWEDANYYARVFKRVMGYPPKYFKKI
ncbi:helix-turn-helix domain-containing protein [Butyricicoccus sp.]|uniref:helix-turn-helix domain-containing protein n=1 Tax=Butyricicoccus sp. TaxID=2049021 RepID=UPI0037357F8A